LAIEILSRHDGFEHVMEKVDEYLQQGVHFVWIVIAGTRKVLVYSAQGQCAEREVLAVPELLPGFELPVAEIFAGLEAKSIHFHSGIKQYSQRPPARSWTTCRGAGEM
jgi:Uma2 family endonuclease